MRCERCGGHATPGLAHLHGNPLRHLCHACTKRELSLRDKERFLGMTSLQTKIVREFIDLILPRAA